MSRSSRGTFSDPRWICTAGETQIESAGSAGCPITGHTNLDDFSIGTLLCIDRRVSSFTRRSTASFRNDVRSTSDGPIHSRSDRGFPDRIISYNPIAELRFEALTYAKIRQLHGSTYLFFAENKRMSLSAINHIDYSQIIIGNWFNWYGLRNSCLILGM